MIKYITRLIDTEDVTDKYSKEDIISSRRLCYLCYLGPLFIFIFMIEDNNKYLLYHLREGINLFAYYLICIILLLIMSLILPSIIISILKVIVGIGYIFLMIVGVLNSLSSRARYLPVIGKYNIDSVLIYRNN